MVVHFVNGSAIKHPESASCLRRTGEHMTAGQQEKLQMLREEKLAANLKALLRRWVEGDQTGFRVSL